MSNNPQKGTELEARRNAIRASMEDVARAAGVSGETVRRAEMGTNVKPRTVDAIEYALTRMETLYEQTRASLGGQDDLRIQIAQMQVQLARMPLLEDQVRDLTRLVHTLVVPESVKRSVRRDTPSSVRSGS